MSKGLAILNGIAGGIEKAANNLYNINLMKTKLTQEQDIFNLTKKQKELEIKKGEYLLSPEQLAAEKAKLDAETKLASAKFNLHMIQIKNEQTKNEKAMEKYKAGMAMVDDFLKGKTKLAPGQSARMGDFAISGQKGSGSGMSLESYLPKEEQGSDKPKTADDFLSQF